LRGQFGAARDARMMRGNVVRREYRTARSALDASSLFLSLRFVWLESRSVNNARLRNNGGKWLTGVTLGARPQLVVQLAGSHFAFVTLLFGDVLRDTVKPHERNADVAKLRERSYNLRGIPTSSREQLTQFANERTLSTSGSSSHT